MPGHVHRVSMFKVPNPDNQQKLIDAYASLLKNQQKEGKPYIVSLTAGQAVDYGRNQGWTVVCKAVFDNMDDVRYFDEQDAAHTSFKDTAKTLGIEGGPAGVMTVCFEGEVSL